MYEHRRARGPFRKTFPKASQAKASYKKKVSAKLCETQSPPAYAHHCAMVPSPPTS